MYSRVPRVGWEAGGCSFSHISIEKNSFWCALWCHFWCDRAGRARPFWCAVTRKYGGAARGSQRAKQRCGPQPLGQQDAGLYLVLTYIEEVRKTLIVMPPNLVSWWGVLLEVVSRKGGDFLRQDGLCENRHTVSIHGRVEGMVTKKWRKRTRCAFEGWLETEYVLLSYWQALAEFMENIQDGRCGETRWSHSLPGETVFTPGA